MKDSKPKTFLLLFIGILPALIAFYFMENN